MRQSYVNAGRYTAVDSILTPPSSLNELEFIDDIRSTSGLCGRGSAGLPIVSRINFDKPG